MADGQAEGRTDGQMTDKVIPKWRSALLAPQKCNLGPSFSIINSIIFILTSFSFLCLTMLAYELKVQLPQFETQLLIYYKLKLKDKNTYSWNIFCVLMKSQKLKTQKLKCYVWRHKSQKFSTKKILLYGNFQQNPLSSSGEVEKVKNSQTNDHAWYQWLFGPFDSFALKTLL